VGLARGSTRRLGATLRAALERGSHERAVLKVAAAALLAHRAACEAAALTAMVMRCLGSYDGALPRQRW
jgi:hypothetical protein